jgi:hypothetical protein
MTTKQPNPALWGCPICHTDERPMLLQWGRTCPHAPRFHECENAERAHVTGKAYVEGRVQAAENWKGE